MDIPTEDTYVGIDLGSQTCRTWWWRKGIAKSCKGSPFPTIVAMTEHFLRGKDASRELETRHTNTLRHIPAALRCRRPVLMEHRSRNNEITIDKALAFLLQAQRDSATATIGHEVKKAVCPVHVALNPLECLRIVNASKAAGFTDLRLLPCTTAAALFWAYDAHRKPLVEGGYLPKQQVLVIDAGCRMTSISIIAISYSASSELNVPEIQLETLCSRGMRAGGYDIDLALCSAAAPSPGTPGVHDVARISAAEKAKKELAVLTESTMQVKGERIQLDRDDLQKASSTFIGQVATVLKYMMDEHKGSTHCLVVGGGNRLVSLKRLVENDYYLRTEVVDPDHAIVMGSALFGASLCKNRPVNVRLTTRREHAHEYWTFPEEAPMYATDPTQLLHRGLTDNLPASGGPWLIFDRLSSVHRSVLPPIRAQAMLSFQTTEMVPARPRTDGVPDDECPVFSKSGRSPFLVVAALPTPPDEVEETVTKKPFDPVPFRVKDWAYDASVELVGLDDANSVLGRYLGWKVVGVCGRDVSSSNELTMLTQGQTSVSVKLRSPPVYEDDELSYIGKSGNGALLEMRDGLLHGMSPPEIVDHPDAIKVFLEANKERVAFAKRVAEARNELEASTLRLQDEDLEPEDLVDLHPNVVELFNEAVQMVEDTSLIRTEAQVKRAISLSKLLQTLVVTQCTCPSSPTSLQEIRSLDAQFNSFTEECMNDSQLSRASFDPARDAPSPIAALPSPSAEPILSPLSSQETQETEKAQPPEEKQREEEKVQEEKVQEEKVQEEKPQEANARERSQTVPTHIQTERRGSLDATPQRRPSKPDLSKEIRPPGSLSRTSKVGSKGDLKQGVPNLGRRSSKPETNLKHVVSKIDTGRKRAASRTNSPPASPTAASRKNSGKIDTSLGATALSIDAGTDDLSASLIERFGTSVATIDAPNSDDDDSERKDSEKPPDDDAPLARNGVKLGRRASGMAPGLSRKSSITDRAAARKNSADASRLHAGSFHRSHTAELSGPSSTASSPRNQPAKNPPRTIAATSLGSKGRLQRAPSINIITASPDASPSLTPKDVPEGLKRDPSPPRGLTKAKSQIGKMLNGGTGGGGGNALKRSHSDIQTRQKTVAAAPKTPQARPAATRSVTANTKDRLPKKAFEGTAKGPAKAEGKDSTTSDVKGERLKPADEAAPAEVEKVDVGGHPEAEPVKGEEAIEKEVDRGARRSGDIERSTEGSARGRTPAEVSEPLETPIISVSSIPHANDTPEESQSESESHNTTVKEMAATAPTPRTIKTATPRAPADRASSTHHSKPTSPVIEPRSVTSMHSKPSSPTLCPKEIDATPPDQPISAASSTPHSSAPRASHLSRLEAPTASSRAKSREKPQRQRSLEPEMDPHANTYSPASTKAAKALTKVQAVTAFNMQARKCAGEDGVARRGPPVPRSQGSLPAPPCGNPKSLNQELASKAHKLRDPIPPQQHDEWERKRRLTRRRGLSQRKDEPVPSTTPAKPHRTPALKRHQVSSPRSTSPVPPSKPGCVTNESLDAVADSDELLRAREIEKLRKQLEQLPLFAQSDSHRKSNNKEV